jgi:hypothetical protein
MNDHVSYEVGNIHSSSPLGQEMAVKDVKGYLAYWSIATVRLMRYVY